MNDPLSIFDCCEIINDLIDNATLKIYLLDKYNKNDMFKMIKKKNRYNYEKRDFFMIMYDLAEIGHWCCMTIDYVEKTAYFYCSFGIFIDGQYDYRVRKSPKDDNDLVRSILRYLFRSGYEVHYNNKAMQNMASSVCGRYCALYLAMNYEEKITPDDFNALIEETCERKNMTPDEVVLNITK